MVKGVGHLGHGEAMKAGGREFSLQGRVVKGVKTVISAIIIIIIIIIIIRFIRIQFDIIL